MYALTTLTWCKSSLSTLQHATSLTQVSASVSPCEQPCPCHSHWRWWEATSRPAPEKPSSGCWRRSCNRTSQEKKGHEVSPDTHINQRAVSSSGHTSSWSVCRSAWSRWSPACGCQGGRTNAVPPCRLQERKGLGGIMDERGRFLNELSHKDHKDLLNSTTFSVSANP